MEVLLAAGADTNVMTSEFEKFKCYSGDVVIKGYSIQIRSPNGLKFTCQTVKMKGWTALKAAKDGHYRDIAELLKKAGAKE